MAGRSNPCVASRWTTILVAVALSSAAAAAPVSATRSRTDSAVWGPYVATYTSEQGFKFRVGLTIPKKPTWTVSLGSPGTESLTITHPGWAISVKNISPPSRPAVALAAFRGDSYFQLEGIWYGPETCNAGIGCRRTHRDGAAITAPGPPSSIPAVVLRPGQSRTLYTSTIDQPTNYSDQPASYVKALQAMYKRRPTYVVLHLYGFGLETDTSPVLGGVSNGMCQPDNGANELILAFTGAGKRINPMSICNLY